MVKHMSIDMFDVKSQADLLRSWFDSEFYKSEYPDIMLGTEDLVEHYFRVGWIEGRNPNPFFDTVSYLLAYKDVAEAFINPYCHYLVYGMSEGRLVAPSSTPSIRTELVFGTRNVRWVEELSGFLDSSYTWPDMPGYELATGRFSVNRTAHFAYRGWREGINPSNSLNIQELKERYSYASALHVNPLLAYIADIRGSYKEPSVGAAGVANSREDTLKSLPNEDIVKISIIRDYFDTEFYLENNPDVNSAGVDPLVHYYFEGWKEGRSPSRKFDTRYYLERYPDVLALQVCPLWHYIETGRKENRLGMQDEAAVSHTLVKPDDAVPLDTAVLEDPSITEAEVPSHSERLALVRESIDENWYLSTYPDVKAADIDPAQHYYYTGWRENRNPSRFFNTEYYLSANVDIKRSGANPFWHYLVAGRAEGRLPRRLGGWRRDALAAVKEPHKRTEGYISKPERLLSSSNLAKTLNRLFTGNACVVSMSHDSYVNVIGGTQIFIADEQIKFNHQGTGYLHLSPVKPLLTLADHTPEYRVRVTLNGKVLGATRMRDLIKALQNACLKWRGSVTYIIHCVFGFSIEDLKNLHSSLRPRRSLFWLHDFSSVCEGFNLLRNDIVFCGAPAPSSLACRVCVYGENRARHVLLMRELFEHCQFQVVAPSKSTLDIWCRAASYTNAGVIVHPHWGFGATPERELVEKIGSKIAVGFLGYPSASKGWPIFLEVVDQLQEDARYVFLHLAARNTSTASEVTFIVTEVSEQDRSAPIRVMRENGLDFIAMLSQWPETFSFATYEAIAAGASVLCFEASGNVAALVRQTGCGVVFSGKDELVEFFRSGAAVVARSEMYQSAGGIGIRDTGTSASITEEVEVVNEN
jgi:hypothetical protein